MVRQQTLVVLFRAFIREHEVLRGLAIQHLMLLPVVILILSIKTALGRCCLTSNDEYLSAAISWRQLLPLALRWLAGRSLLL